CEIEHEGIRYILRKNPVRAEEIHDNRNKKVEKISKIVDEKNIYLPEHQKVEVSTALAVVNERIEKLNISGF
ncbi:hypothetical protein B1A_13128, partial [mine drainage metagenome]